MIFARKMPDYIIRQGDQGQAETKSVRARQRPKFWFWGHFGQWTFYASSEGQPRSSDIHSRWPDDFRCSARSAVWPLSQHGNLHMTLKDTLIHELLTRSTH